LNEWYFKIIPVWISFIFANAMILFNILLFFSACSFTYFGLACLINPSLKTEFIRYGLDKQRNTVGILQITGAVGLLVGYFYLPILVLIAAVGLALLMLLGFGVRLKIKDSVVQSAPSLIYAFINTYIAYLQFLNIF